ncbi:unknown [Feldmannia species virus]|uniref:Uncharacterized protein n=1 Tax=Feldmannia species virus TaxID=39420 RepID=B5LWB0_9PHYC|nr:hypothetical protein FeldSpV_gp021 [Feldmannia species virus]ACH46773.1 unknown [Feldmannia species virus]
MDGAIFGNTGVSLLSGSGIVVGESITLFSGGRSWRLRLPSSSESEDNILVFEYKSGARWVQAAVFAIPPT